MKDMSAALEDLTDRDPDRRDVAAASLGDLLRGTALDADTARLVVGRLVSLTVNEPVTQVRESALNAVSEAFNHHRLPLDLVRPLAAAMPTMETEILGHTIYILGAAHAPKALPMIEPFLNHPDQDVREEARLAAAEITASNPEDTIHNS
ncbi:HEAT repeat protein [Streptomyces scabiei]|uniref:HEAT repeat protein n=2 Tax=Streptomyces scabiei TaxID=1930 RepID=A0A100JWQ4_STRSC|nr:HEAT repeat protein [Streptomyces scabiei]